MYKTALQEGYTYPSNRGLLTTEDLFSLPLESRSGFNLYSIGNTLNEKLSDTAKNLFGKQSDDEKLIQAKIDIIKDIVADKLAEAAAKAEVKANKAKREKILTILAKKGDEALEGKSEAELIAELEKLA